jgi:predicted membrane channel-forming protein YqfA (hemolysin III family)
MADSSHLLSIPGFSDPVSSLSHLAGAVLFAILGVALVMRGRGEARRVFSLAVFAFSCVLLLSLSGVYHLLQHETPARSVLMRLDHAAIFVLIAGSFTPVHAILLHNRWQRHLLAWIWGGRARRSQREDPVFRHHALVVGAGDVPWPGMAGNDLHYCDRTPFRLALRSASAVGCACLHDRRPGGSCSLASAHSDIVGPHELFHLAVLAGISFHWAFIRTIASGAYDRALHPQVPVLHVFARG